MKLAVIGKGKLGRTVARAAAEAGLEVTHHAARGPLAGITAELVLLATRESDLEPLARRLAGEVRGVALHCAGARDAEVLAPLRASGVAVGAMHPAISFVDDAGTLAGAVVISGDEEAVGAARKLARALALRPVVAQGLDRGLYHAALALAANGGAALAAVASELSAAAGLTAEQAASVIGPLLVSVGRNVERLGAHAALSGPVRRGSVATIDAHLEAIREHRPEHLELYRALLRAQLPLARELGEATANELSAIEALERGLERGSE